MSANLEESDSVFDPIPETELLDNSIQKGRAQLSVKTRRQRPSRSHYRDSVSSTEGDESMDRKEDSAHSPLRLTMRGSSPSPDSLLSVRSPAFSFDTSLVRRSPEDGGLSLAATPRRRYHQLTNATSQEALATPTSSPSKSCPSSSDVSPVYTRRSRRPDSEFLVSDPSRDSSPADPGSPPVLDKKTKRRFLDLGVTLRRSYLRVKKDKSERLSAGSRETSESPSRASASFVSFSWFSEGRGSLSSSGTPPCSPQNIPLGSGRPRKSSSQESALSEEFSPPQTSPSACPHVELSSSLSSHPYHTLSQSSDEPSDETSSQVSSWTTQQVCDWLGDVSMDQYVPEFRAADVDGQQLLQLDGSKLKGLGVLSSSDRGALKRRVKALQAAAEKERKALDKMEKQKEKQRRKEQEQRRN
ncbi:sterile alpha motif domain-containing protein 14 isoform X2 [Dunckerocampus dactyliophorus]|uniref:sterile alpha motif domain-containing protein 14 isoform X2 n=1 Tax=Dunckerocampus dactyliophorus TaxID=161453 RepID=UPI002406A56B|nr:sterile alpha motif domain-containing protein 14 isoform X2 [Dunckerocampus dactyliophorus]